MAGKKVTRSEDWWDTLAPSHVLRCTATYKRSGLRCRREAATGTTVCNQHGALIPAVQAAAANRIQMSVEDAAKALKELAFDENGDPRVRLKAIQDLLDRGGLGVTSKYLVGVGPADPVEALFRSILSDPNALRPVEPIEPRELPAAPSWDEMKSSYDQHRSRSRDDDEDLIGDVVDADVVEDYEDLIGFPELDRISSTPPKHTRDALKDLL